MSSKFDLAIVGGSDLTKIHKQLGDSNISLIEGIYYFKFVCTENGLVTYINTDSEKLKKYYTRVLILFKLENQRGIRRR